MTVSKDYFLALFDEFSTVPTKKIEVYLSLAQIRVSQSQWGNAYQAGVCYLAAHMLVSAGGNAGSQSGSGGAAGGPLTQEAVGDLSRSFGTVGVQGSGDELLMTTRYGQMFLDLRRETIMGFGVTGNPPIVPGVLVYDGEIC